LKFSFEEEVITMVDHDRLSLVCTSITLGLALTFSGCVMSSEESDECYETDEFLSSDGADDVCGGEAHELDASEIDDKSTLFVQPATCRGTNCGDPE
jgi:hypothetical protein